MSANEIAAKRLQAFLNKVGRVPAIGGFGPKARQQPATDSSFALRGAVSHAREALDALERGDTGAFLVLYQAFRDFQLDAERREADALASLAVEAERQHAEERVEAERAEALAKVEAERCHAEERVEAVRQHAEERVEAEREIRHRGPRKKRPKTRTQARLDAAAFELAATLGPGAYERGGRLNVARLARLVAEAATQQRINVGMPTTIEARIRREADKRGINLAEWLG